MKADKGKKGGSCNRTACQAAGAHFFNKSTKAYYCAACAKDINRLNAADSLKLYGTPFLCEEEDDLS